ncbi:hypothetical protein CANCADRAFT_17076, partial [Tortispora caseinolytica NRRL Y-17796]
VLNLHQQLLELAVDPEDAHKETILYIAGLLSSLNFTVEIYPFELPSAVKANVYVYYGNRTSAKTVMVSHIGDNWGTQLDGANPYNMQPETPLNRQDDKIYGTGSARSKASMATVLTSFISLYAENEVYPGDVALLFVGGDGAHGHAMSCASNAIQDIPPKTVLFSTQSSNRLVSAYKGLIWLKIKGIGTPSPGAKAHNGLSALSVVLSAADKIQNLPMPLSAFLGKTKTKITNIYAGDLTENAPTSAVADVLIRTTAHTDRILRMLRGCVRNLTGVSLDIKAVYEPLILSSWVSGFKVTVSDAITDIPFFRVSDTDESPSFYAYGPGVTGNYKSGAENISEYSLLKAVYGYRKLI